MLVLWAWAISTMRCSNFVIKVYILKITNISCNKIAPRQLLYLILNYLCSITQHLLIVILKTHNKERYGGNTNHDKRNNTHYDNDGLDLGSDIEPNIFLFPPV